MMIVKGLTGPQADSVHRIGGLMAPQAALDSVAATRRQAQIDDIASGTPRLMEKAVARGSWFVARNPPPLDKNGLWLNFTAGCPLGQPLRTRPLPCVFIISRKRYSIHRLYAIP